MIFLITILSASCVNTSSPAAESGDGDQAQEMMHDKVMKDTSCNGNYFKIVLSRSPNSSLKIWTKTADGQVSAMEYTVSSLNNELGSHLPSEMIEEVDFYNFWIEGCEHGAVKVSLSINKMDTDYGAFIEFFVYPNLKLKLDKIEVY